MKFLYSSVSQQSACLGSYVSSSPITVIDSTPLDHCPSRTASPTSKRRRRLSKSVSFADDALLYPSTVTLEEAWSMWYSRDELALFKSERKDMVKVLKKNNFNLELVGYHFCLRGLEPYFSVDVNKETKQARDCVMQNVFDEQDKQRGSGRYEPESLRSVVVNSTKWAMHNALQLGSRDAVEALAIYEKSMLEQFETELNMRAEKGLLLGRRGVKKSPSLTQQEASVLSRSLQIRQN
jgi:hypothetical protein